MKHNKKDEKTEHRGFKYEKCKPLNMIPQSLYEEAQQSIFLWNKLVELHNEYSEKRLQFCREHSPIICELESKYKLAKEKHLTAHTEFKKAKMNKKFVAELKTAKDILRKKCSEIYKKLKEERASVLKQHPYKEEIPFLKAARELRKTAPTLHSGHAEETIVDFINTRERFFKGIGGPPKFKSQFDNSFSLRLRNKACGWDIDSLYKCSNFKTKFWMDIPDEKGKTIFYWRCGNAKKPKEYDTVAFKVTIHRPLPQGAKVKSVTLKKDKHIWSLVFNIEEKPGPKLPHGDKTIYFSPRWSQDNYTGDIFMGHLFVDGSVKPIYLFDTVDLHKDKAKMIILDKLSFLESLNTKADKIIEGLKAEISKHMMSIKEFTGWEGNLSLCRSGGLRKLLRLLKQSLPKHPLTRTLDMGLKRYARIMMEYSNSRKRLSRFRKDCYWNFGKKLAEISQEIYLDDLNFKRLGMKKDIENIPEEVASKIRKHKSCVAHYEFYDIIQKQCDKHGVTVYKTDFTKNDIVRSGIKMKPIYKSCCN